MQRVYESTAVITNCLKDVAKQSKRDSAVSTRYQVLIVYGRSFGANLRTYSWCTLYLLRLAGSPSRPDLSTMLYRTTKKQTGNKEGRHRLRFAGRSKKNGESLR